MLKKLIKLCGGDLKDTGVMTGTRAHTLLIIEAPELESGALNRSATTPKQTSNPALFFETRLIIQKSVLINRTDIGMNNKQKSVPKT